MLPSEHAKLQQCSQLIVGINQANCEHPEAELFYFFASQHLMGWLHGAMIACLHRRQSAA